jgi:iron-sulfur cluster insertion protein
MDIITVTKEAREKITAVLDEEKLNYLRFGLKGGGCSGFQYFFRLDDVLEEDDLKIEISPDKFLLIDSMSAMYLTGAEIGFKKDMMGESFTFTNPNQTTSCGCGKSVGF